MDCTGIDEAMMRELRLPPFDGAPAFVLADDADSLMPPPKSGKKLTAKEVEIAASASSY